MMKTKFAAAALSIGCTLMISALPASADMPASGQCGENLTWTMDDTNTVTISGEGAMFDYSASESNPWEGQHLSGLIIEEGVTDIGNYAFYACTLDNVSLPSTLKSIGDCAFAGSFSFSNNTVDLALPDSVEEIGAFAFSWRNIKLRITKLSENLITIGESAFSEGCTLDMDNIMIPASVQRIGNKAFAVAGMTSITIEAKDCVIEDNDNGATISNNENWWDYEEPPVFSGTIYGYTGSTAQAYANKYHYSFAALDAEQTTAPETATTTTAAAATTATATTTAAGATTTTTVGASNTGETGTAIFAALLLTAAGTAYVCRRKKD